MVYSLDCQMTLVHSYGDALGCQFEKSERCRHDIGILGFRKIQSGVKTKRYKKICITLDGRSHSAMLRVWPLSRDRRYAGRTGLRERMHMVKLSDGVRVELNHYHLSTPSRYEWY